MDVSGTGSDLLHGSKTTFPAIHRQALQTLQLNLGYRCNLSCRHCHISAGPKRQETMPWEIMATAVRFAEQHAVTTVDLTGGAPELNPYFRQLVSTLHTRTFRIINRCNLAVLDEPGQEDLPEFLARHGVAVVASLPCYLEENVDRQRGDDTFAASIRGLRRLNALGYGVPGSPLTLDLVYNPQRPVLPPAQEPLEQDYRRELAARYQISFSGLLVMTNMPIGRFGATLQATGQLEQYHALLRHHHTPANLDRVMCRTLLSVDWRGQVYDCDFNQALDLPLGAGHGSPVHLADLMATSLTGHIIRTGLHCHGCTVGQGSSCGGALV